MNDNQLERKAVKLILSLIHEEVLKKSEIKNPEEVFRNNTNRFETQIKEYIEKNISKKQLIKILKFYDAKEATKYFHMMHKRQFLQLTDAGVMFLSKQGVLEISYDSFFINVIATFLEAALC